MRSLKTLLLIDSLVNFKTRFYSIFKGGFTDLIPELLTIKFILAYINNAFLCQLILPRIESLLLHTFIQINNCDMYLC